MWSASGGNIASFEDLKDYPIWQVYYLAYKRIEDKESENKLFRQRMQFEAAIHGVSLDNEDSEEDYVTDEPIKPSDIPSTVPRGNFHEFIKTQDRAKNG